MGVTLLGKIEAIQRDAFARIGVNEEDIGSHFLAQLSEFEGMPAHLRRAGPAFERVFGGQTMREILDDVARFKLGGRATRYQDPVMQMALEGLWHSAEPVTLTPMDSSDPLPTPLIVSAPTGNFNAQALSDMNGGCAILFETELMAIAQAVSTMATLALFEDQEERIVGYQDPDEIAARVMHDRELTEAIDRFFGDLVTTGRPNLDRSIKGRAVAQPEIQRLATLMARGFTLFVMCHELSHLRMQHHATLHGRPGARRPVRPVEELRVAKALFHEYYKARFSEPSQEQVENFAFAQVLEIEADAYGYWGMFRAAVELPAARKNPHWALLHHLGGVLFFWTVEMLERYLRLHAGGVPAACDPLFDEHCIVADMMLRGMHPSPLSRLRSVELQVRALADAEHMMPQGIVEPLSATIAAVFGTAWQFRLFRELGQEPTTRPISERWRHEFSQFGAMLQAVSVGRHDVA